MKQNLKNEIVRLLIDRNPNWVSEAIIKNHVSKCNDTAIKNALQELCDADFVKKEIDPRQGQIKSVDYYRIILDNLDIRETIKVGNIEFPRILSLEKLHLLPENLNEQIQQLAKYSKSLDDYAAKLERIEKEQKNYWAKTITVFTILLGLLAVVLDKLPRTITTPSLGLKDLLWQNFVPLIPFCSIIIVFALVIYFVIKK